MARNGKGPRTHVCPSSPAAMPHRGNLRWWVIFQQLGFFIHHLRAPCHGSRVLSVSCAVFRGGWLCAPVFHLVPRRSTRAAELLHRLAHGLQRYCSAQSGSTLLLASSDDRGGRDWLPVTTLEPLIALPLRLSAAATDTLLFWPVCLGPVPVAPCQIPLPFVIFDVLS